MYDKDKYFSTRGVYMEPEELYAVKVYTEQQLINVVRNISDYDYRINEQNADLFISNQNGEVSKKIVDVILENKRDYRIIKFNNNKETILIFLDALLDYREINTKINLINSIDFDSHNVILLLIKDKLSDLEVNIIKKIKKEVKIFFKFGFINIIKDEWLTYYRFMNGDRDISHHDISKIVTSEIKRLLSEIRIDYTINLASDIRFITCSALLQNPSMKKRISYLDAYFLMALKDGIDLEWVKSLYAHFDFVCSTNPFIKIEEYFTKNREKEFIIDEGFLPDKNTLNTFEKAKVGTEEGLSIFLNQNQALYFKNNSLNQKNILLYLTDQTDNEVINLINEYKKSNCYQAPDFHLILYGMNNKCQEKITDLFGTNITQQKISFMPRILDIRIFYKIIDFIDLAIIASDISLMTPLVSYLLNMKKNILVKDSYYCKELITNDFVNTFKDNLLLKLELFYQKSQEYKQS